MEDFCKLVVVKIGVYLLGFIFKIVMKICQINEVKRAVSLLWCIILGWGPELGPRAGGLGRAVKGALAVLLVHPATIFRGGLLWGPFADLGFGPGLDGFLGFLDRVRGPGVFLELHHADLVRLQRFPRPRRQLPLLQLH